MKTLRFTSVLIFILTTATVELAPTYGQKQDIDDGFVCPTVAVNCPENDSGRVIDFRVTVQIGVPATKVNFKWKVSGGKITKGQGTEEITVKSKRHKGELVTATVEVFPVPKGCNSTASCSTTISRN